MKKTIKIFSIMLAGASFAHGTKNEDNNNKDNEKNSGQEIVKQEIVKQDNQCAENTEGTPVPEEILAEIFSFVDWKNTPKLRLVHRSFDEIIRNPKYKDINIAFCITNYTLTFLDYAENKKDRLEIIKKLNPNTVISYIISQNLKKHINTIGSGSKRHVKKFISKEIKLCYNDFLTDKFLPNTENIIKFKNDCNLTTMEFGQYLPLKKLFTDTDKFAEHLIESKKVASELKKERILVGEPIELQIELFNPASIEDVNLFTKENLKKVKETLAKLKLNLTTLKLYVSRDNKNENVLEAIKIFPNTKVLFIYGNPYNSIKLKYSDDKVYFTSAFWDKNEKKILLESKNIELIKQSLPKLKTFYIQGKSVLKE